MILFDEHLNSNENVFNKFLIYLVYIEEVKNNKSLFRFTKTCMIFIK